MLEEPRQLNWIWHAGWLLFAMQLRTRYCNSKQEGTASIRNPLVLTFNAFYSHAKRYLLSSLRGAHRLRKTPPRPPLLPSLVVSLHVNSFGADGYP
jgi:hypothetical protein